MERTGDKYQLIITLQGLESSALAPKKQINYPILSKIRLSQIIATVDNDLSFRQKKN